MRRKLITAAAAAVLFAAPALAQGPGMMGDGMMMGPGMMGPGMMGGGGAMGPGMMGPGMMGGGGAMGPGMMGGYPGANLSAEQRAKISAIQRETARKQWALMGEMRELQFHMHDALGSGKVNEAEARKAYDAMSAAHKQMFETMLAARKRIESELGGK
jgi:Spy/CpxP family protein refolding chaperone